MTRSILALLALTILLGSPVFAHGKDTPHFHCSVCGAHDHGSLWHDKDKDGKRDRVCEDGPPRSGHLEVRQA